MDEVDLILEDILFEAHIIDVKKKPMRLVVCHGKKEVTLKLTKTLMVGGGKLNMV